MKKVLLGLMAFSIIMVVGCNNEASNNNSKKDTTNTTNTTPEKKMTPEEQQKAWAAYATPGEMHQWLAKYNGTWETDYTSWPNPDSPSVNIQSKGMAVYKSILGGRYQEGTFTGTMWGQPFEGRSLSGYDNAKKVFFSTWIDNMGSGIMRMEGTYDEKTKTLTSKGKMVDPTTGKELDVKEELVYVDDNTQKMTMYHTDASGKEIKDMEMTAKRKM